MIDGIVTDIQKYSLHDGPGIRSTVFLKGCNFRCTWCHNPETIHFQPELAFYAQKCMHCGACYSACQKKALSIRHGQRIYRKDECCMCGNCAYACPTGAISVIGRKMTAEECIQAVSTDSDYYKNSDHGGVTVSGGEPLMQAEFAAAILKGCKERGYDTAIETNLSADFAKLEAVLPYLDRIFCDFKLIDNEAHKHYTGRNNALLMSNLMQLRDYGLPVVVRTPLIPGVTDSIANITAIAEWLRNNAKPDYYELLNYNPLAEAKHQYVARDYEHAAAKPIPKARLKLLVDAGDAAGVRTLCWEE